MGFELVFAVMLLAAIIGMLIILRPHRSTAPERHITSSRNGYGRGKGQ